MTVQREKLVVPSQIVGLKKQDGKRIIKIFVSDTSLTSNGDRLHKDFQDTIVQTLKGKPYLIPPFLDHPKAPNLSNNIPLHIEAIKTAAKPYEAGLVYDLERVSSEDNPGYNAFVELTSDFAVKLFDEGILPRFVSTSVYKTNPAEPNNEIKSAVVNNICAVRNPAFGAKARILGMCVGDRESCKSELVESSDKTGVDAINKLNSSIAQMTGTSTTDGHIVKLEGKCDTMRAVESLPSDDLFTVDNTSFISSEVTSSDMSADAGTTTSETTITYPESKRVVKKDGRGNIISETKMDEQKKEETTQTQMNTKEGAVKEETKEKTVEKEVQKKVSTEEEEKDEEEEERKRKGEKPTVEAKKEEKTEQSPAETTDRVGTLEQQVKQLSNRFDKANKTIEWYRRDMISTAINNANWLKPEQKEERINRYNEMDIAGEDLKLALTDAFGPQMAQIRSSNPERKSSEQYHEDTFTGSGSNADQPKTSNNDKLTLDLLRRNTRK